MLKTLRPRTAPSGAADAGGRGKGRCKQAGGDGHIKRVPGKEGKSLLKLQGVSDLNHPMGYYKKVSYLLQVR